MAIYASVDDVQVSLMRQLTPSEGAATGRLLEFASALVRQQVPQVEDRLAAGTLDQDVVASVVTAMVVRVLRNPDARRQETRSVDDAARSWTIDAALSSGALYVSETELASLRVAPAGDWAGSVGYASWR